MSDLFLSIETETLYILEDMKPPVTVKPIRIQDAVDQSTNGNTEQYQRRAHFAQTIHTVVCLKFLSTLFYFWNVCRSSCAPSWSPTTRLIRSLRQLPVASNASARTSWENAPTRFGGNTGTRRASPESTTRRRTRARANRWLKKCTVTWTTAPCPRGSTGRFHRSHAGSFLIHSLFF